MSEKIEQAMTAEEWASNEAKIGFCSSATGNGSSVMLELSDCGYEGYTTYVSGKERHGLAAICLNGQSFGFSREDLELLRTARDAGRIEGGVAGEEIRYAGRPIHFGEQLKLMELAARIEALLPPETATRDDGEGWEG